MRPHFRPPAPAFQKQQGISVYYPKFISVPGYFKGWDGFFMAAACGPLLKRIQKTSGFDLIDAHFAYPDGYAAVQLGRRFNVPVTVTLRGTEVPLSRDPIRREKILKALDGASRVFSVSESLKNHAVSMGVEAEKIEVVGNGVDTEKFYPLPRDKARRELKIPQNAQVLITVGALVPRKGQQRVIEILPFLLRKYPDLLYLVVGGASPEGDMTESLQAQVMRLGLEKHVRFLGPLPPERLKRSLSAADVFVLATANEGWANVFLEAMACGLPVITTEVGGNREVVCRDDLGTIIPLSDADALKRAIDGAMRKKWNRDALIAYAADNDWNKRVVQLVRMFNELTGGE
ncbi:glycosyltransferase [Methylohalobius crimeensis]|uniref:glycosyltransferase n=1 Tax=Methylohalobius crimeensis TaxID=244365 RepID=UPI001F26B94A|nr:glycosyltransferase [Methylohalobius crimeensis]